MKKSCKLFAETGAELKTKCDAELDKIAVLFNLQAEANPPASKKRRFSKKPVSDASQTRRTLERIEIDDSPGMTAVRLERDAWMQREDDDAFIKCKKFSFLTQIQFFFQI